MGINHLFELLQEKNFDFAFFYNLESTGSNPNMIYFTGYNGIGALIVPKNKKPILIVPKMEYGRAKKGKIENVYAMDKKKLFDSINIIIKKSNLKKKTICIDSANFNLQFFRHFRKNFKGTRIKDISLDCLKFRQVKSYEEIQTMRKGFNQADKILSKAVSNFKDFKTESEISAFLEYEAKKQGYGISFPAIVASGKNASEPHHEPSNVKLNGGFCVIDFGITYKNYCTDCTRTVYNGSPSISDKKIYEKLLSVQKSCIDNSILGGNCGKVYESCVSRLGKYSKYFTHGLGHGVGVEIHELPNITINSKDKLLEHSVFTIEPGIYLPNKLGIRIEDTLVMEKKPSFLTRLSKDLLIV
jgi:Xaa-Pro aminopeptidase